MWRLGKKCTMQESLRQVLAQVWELINIVYLTRSLRHHPMIKFYDSLIILQVLPSVSQYKDRVLHCLCQVSAMTKSWSSVGSHLHHPTLGAVSSAELFFPAIRVAGLPWGGFQRSLWQGKREPLGPHPTQTRVQLQGSRINDVLLLLCISLWLSCVLINSKSTWGRMINIKNKINSASK